MIRQHIVVTLLRREIRRLQKNPAALMLIGLLVAIAFLVSLSGPPGNSSRDVSADQADQPMRVAVVFDEDTPLVRDLTASPALDFELKIRDRRNVTDRNGRLRIPDGWAIVELRNAPRHGNGISVVARYVGASPDSLEPFWKWFGPRISVHHHDAFLIDQKVVQRPAPKSRSLQDKSLGELINGAAIGTSLLLVVQFFSCCHLLVSFTAQDRERKTLTALALSPARLSEIMLAKGIFHLALSMIGSMMVVGILNPVAVLNPVLWITLTLTSTAMMCVGTCIATLARNQAAAGMLALCYMMSGALLFYLATKLTAFALLKGLAFESYSFILLYLAFQHPEHILLARALLPLAALTALWMVLARTCFYRFGWR